MKTAVIKFGGSSLCDADGYRRCASLLNNNEYNYYVVVSAPGRRFDGDFKITDLLIGLLDCPSQRQTILNKIKVRFDTIKSGLSLDIDLSAEYDNLLKYAESGDRAYVVSRGEYFSALIMASLLHRPMLDSAYAIIFNGDRISEKISFNNISDFVYKKGAFVMPGFYGSDEGGNIKLFSRGGGDISGSVVGAAIDADIYFNITDVDGIMSADPRICSDFCRITHFPYSDAEFLSHFGAGVIHHDAVSFAEKYGLKINIRSVVNSDGGTLIDNIPENHVGITAISYTDNITNEAADKYGISGGCGHIGIVGDFSEGYFIGAVANAIEKIKLYGFSAVDDMRHIIISADKKDCRTIAVNIAKIITAQSKTNYYTLV